MDLETTLRRSRQILSVFLCAALIWTGGGAAQAAVPFRMPASAARAGLEAFSGQALAPHPTSIRLSRPPSLPGVALQVFGLAALVSLMTGGSLEPTRLAISAMHASARTFLQAWMQGQGSLSGLIALLSVGGLGMMGLMVSLPTQDRRVTPPPNESIVDVVGDVDGWLNRFQFILQRGGWIRRDGSWAGGMGRLIQAGDIIGRAGGALSEETFEYSRLVQREAEAAGGQVERLLGNHEWAIYRGPPEPGDRDRLGADGVRRLQEKIKEDIAAGRLKVATVAGDRIVTHAGIHMSLWGEMLPGAMGLSEGNYPTLQQAVDFLNQIAVDHARGLDVPPSRLTLLENLAVGALTWIARENDYLFAAIPQITAHHAGNRIRIQDSRGLVVNTDLGIHDGNLGFLRMQLREEAQPPDIYSVYLSRDENPRIERLTYVGSAPPGGPRWQFEELLGENRWLGIGQLLLAHPDRFSHALDLIEDDRPSFERGLDAVMASPMAKALTSAFIVDPTSIVCALQVLGRSENRALTYVKRDGTMDWNRLFKDAPKILFQISSPSDLNAVEGLLRALSWTFSSDRITFVNRSGMRISDSIIQGRFPGCEVIQEEPVDGHALVVSFDGFNHTANLTGPLDMTVPINPWKLGRIIPSDRAEIARLRGLLAISKERPLIVASTPRAEEIPTLLKAYAAFPSGKRPLLVIGLRSPNPALESSLAAYGITNVHVRRSSMEDLRMLSRTDVVILETYGELSGFKSAADVEIVGSDSGIEGAAAGVSTLLFDGDWPNNREIRDLLVAAGGAEIVDPERLHQQIVRHLANPARHAEPAQRVYEQLKDHILPAHATAVSLLLAEGLLRTRAGREDTPPIPALLEKPGNYATLLRWLHAVSPILLGLVLPALLLLLKTMVVLFAASPAIFKDRSWERSQGQLMDRHMEVSA